MSNIIHILNKRIALAQHEGGFQTSIDAVLLAAACPAHAGERLLDLGCGVGSASLAALKRIENTILTGIDILPEVVELAKHNARLNAMVERTDFQCIDVRDFEDLSFDHVICNPPFLDAGEHVRSPSQAKATAMGFGEDDMDLKDWVDCAYRSITGQGSLTLIHRADQIDEIIRAMGKRFGAVEIIPLWPKAGQEAKRVIVRARKHRKSPARLHVGIVLHQENGDYTAHAENILREIAPIA
ncbi:MAG: methyltransferase [Alphaproteobacteria bacterium]|nr:methyltransferase [Alphaproteobacteria bacterium]